MDKLRTTMKSAAGGSKAQSRVDGIVRRGLAETADGANDPALTAARPTDDELDTGFNPYDTAGPETLGRHWAGAKPSRNAKQSGGAGNPYDTASEYSDRKRSWDDALIDTDDRRSRR